MKPPAKPSACADTMKVLSEQTRLVVLQELLAGPRNVTELNARLRLDQSLLSHHLKVLREAGLVVSAREGKSVRYSISPDVRGADPNSIELGCCRFSFADLPRRKS